MPATMKAMRVHETGGAFQLDEVPVPQPGSSDSGDPRGTRLDQGD